MIAGRTGQPVRRNSRHCGERELRAWKANNTFSKSEHNARMRALENVAREEKTANPGRPSTLNANVRSVYRALLSRRDYKSGRLDLALTTIAKLLGLSKQTVVVALKRLKAAGFLDWMRRSRPVDNPDPFGPQVQQETNAYILLLPKAAADMVRRLCGRAPVPDDARHHEAEQAAQLSAMLETLSAEELARFRAGDMSALSDALAALGRRLDQAGNASPEAGLNPALQGKG